MPSVPSSDFLVEDRDGDKDEAAAAVALRIPVEAPDLRPVGRPSGPVAALSAAAQAEIDAFGAQYPFALDGFQIDAIGHFLRDESVLVAAPTGSGKTVVGEFGIYHAIKGTGRVFYTTPIKALSNQKFRDLRQIYGSDVGLLTGDVSENRDARVLVMTTEILRNMLLQTPWEVDDVRCVIFDEIHYLADRDRGTTWEEAIILCPEHIQFICLSATVSNAGEIADWISHTHRPIRLVTHLRRAVPLALEYFVDGELEVVVDHHGKQINDFSKPKGRTKQERRVQRRGGDAGPSRTPRFNRERDEPQPREVIDVLAEQKRLPAIYFLFSRNDCQKYAEGLAAARPSLATPEQVTRIDEIVANHLRELRPEDFALEQVRTITYLVRRGIGFHHAGLLPILKQLVEVLFGRGLMQVVFATDTLALGVNMPARSVVIGRLSKWDGRQRRLLIPNEFQQMAGRAGRRGMDRFGHVVVPFSPFVPFGEMLAIATGPLLPVRSAFTIRYNTVLNLWDPPEGERVRQLLQESLAEYQSSQRVRQVERDLLEIGGDVVAAQQAMAPGYDETERLLGGYRDLVAALTEAQGRLRTVQLDLDVATSTQQDRRPWTEPGRHVLRRLLRQEEPGLVMHERSRGWGVSLGRGTAGGAGLFLFGDRIEVVPEYRDIDFLPDGARVDLPDDLIEPPEGVRDATELVSRETLDAIAAGIAALDLPDLDARLAEFQGAEGARLERRRSDLATQVAALDDEVRDLIERRDDHPAHDRRTRKGLQTNLAQVDRLFQEQASFNELLRTEQRAEEARVRGVIRGIRDVLHRFGYLDQGYPTGKADMLAGIFDNDGVIICEMIVRGWLDNLLPEDLAELFSWYCFDRDSRFTNGYTLSPAIDRLRLRIDELEADVLEEEHAHDLFISGGHNTAFYGAVRAWCLGATMVEIGETIELSEGDLVLTFNKTIDLMRQVRDMLRDVLDDSPLIPLLRQAERLMRRGIVEQSLSLGFAPADQPEVPIEGAVDAEMTPAIEAP